MPHISLAAEKITTIFGFPITNSLLMTWAVMAFLIMVAYKATDKMSLVPNNLQSIFEMVIDGVHSLFLSVVGERNIGRFFPLLATIFLFVLFANWSGLLPGVGSIGIYETEHGSAKALQVGKAYATEATTTQPETLPEANLPGTGTENAEKPEKIKLVPIFRGPTADLNTTLALAIVAVASLQYFGFQSLGIHYATKFLNFSNPINFFLGILELISEVAKVISFAFRLFGNIFAGEVLLTVIAFLMPLFAPLPFLGMELFVGVIQALVFSMLTAVFLNMAVISHSEH